MKKYFKSKKEANRVKEERTRKGAIGLHVWRMPKGSRKAGFYAVCSEIEYLNS